MPEFVDVKMIEGLALPYVVGAEADLTSPDLDPFNAAWHGCSPNFPGGTTAGPTCGVAERSGPGVVRLRQVSLRRDPGGPSTPPEQ